MCHCCCVFDNVMCNLRWLLFENPKSHKLWTCSYLRLVTWALICSRSHNTKGVTFEVFFNDGKHVFLGKLLWDIPRENRSPCESPQATPANVSESHPEWGIPQLIGEDACWGDTPWLKVLWTHSKCLVLGLLWLFSCCLLIEWLREVTLQTDVMRLIPGVFPFNGNARRKRFCALF